MTSVTSVLIYNASWHTFGGGEKYICALADALSRTGRYAVTLLIDRPDITREGLQRHFNLDMESVELRPCSRGNVPRMLQSADIGVVVSNFKPFGLMAKKNVYIVQIPYAAITPGTIARKAIAGYFREAAKDMLRSALLRDVRKADLVLVYSEFVRSVLQRHHGIRGSLLYPPIDDFQENMPRENMILSVGRFFRGLYNNKRYDLLIGAFRQLRERLPHTSWTYHLAGSCGTDAPSQLYLEELRSAATGHPIYFHVNSPYEELKRLYNQAEIFWHAAGYGVDEDVFPERTEHFGMSTAEAMSAGCIPVVIDKGGQKEIVSHGKSGYLWTTLDELLDQTTLLINDPDRRSTLRQQTRQRFQDFDRQHFSGRLISLFTHLDND